jgi:hypothetical protein
MAARPALLTDFDVERTGSGQRFVHRDGRPFTPEEADLIGSATDDDMRAAARELPPLSAWQEYSGRTFARSPKGRATASPRSQHEQPGVGLAAMPINRGPCSEPLVPTNVPTGLLILIE